MPSVLYCHGFLSGPTSKKALQMKAMVEAQEGWRCITPDLSRPPREVDALLREIVQTEGEQLQGVMGSSLGGFWAGRVQAEFSHLKAVLINPCINPWAFIPQWAGWRDLYYEPRRVWVDPSFEGDFLALHDAIPLSQVNPRRTVVILGQKDEVLDWRLAHEYFAECEQWILPDGDHGLTDFESFARASCAFFASPHPL